MFFVKEEEAVNHFVWGFSRNKIFYNGWVVVETEFSQVFFGEETEKVAIGYEQTVSRLDRTVGNVGKFHFAGTHSIGDIYHGIFLLKVRLIVAADGKLEF